jgi:hypothetical protein
MVSIFFEFAAQHDNEKERDKRVEKNGRVGNRNWYHLACRKTKDNLCARKLKNKYKRR